MKATVIPKHSSYRYCHRNLLWSSITCKLFLFDYLLELYRTSTWVLKPTSPFQGHANLSIFFFFGFAFAFSHLFHFLKIHYNSSRREEAQSLLQLILSLTHSENLTKMATCFYFLPLLGLKIRNWTHFNFFSLYYWLLS